MTERLIREAHEDGRFDDLPGRGRRLDLEDDPREGEMGLAFHILRTNRVVPPWIAADQEVRRCAASLERLLADATAAGQTGRRSATDRARFHARLARLVEEHDRAVEALNAGAPSLTVHRRRLDRDALEDRLARSLEGHADQEGDADGIPSG